MVVVQSLAEGDERQTLEVRRVVLEALVAEGVWPAPLIAALSVRYTLASVDNATRPSLKPIRSVRITPVRLNPSLPFPPRRIRTPKTEAASRRRSDQ